ncbi:hypothetical protein Mgra_00006292 [Meloidogyne graminicola]|uniref:Peptidase S1 domain-containing protein n=1 Tax=Meloidogyne graminicola TaxID=189291 RepID=A0A8S9ZMM7_9BILA|nr:hypothetical protein Mgra_00006292 [Meloidogyne graminicola]
MAIIIFNNYNNYYFIPFMFPTIIYSNIEINKNTETFAFGYGITEYQQIPEEPHKVSIKLTKNSSECTIEFNFSGTAKSCLGDSGGPVFSYFRTQQASSLLFKWIQWLVFYEKNIRKKELLKRSI